MNKPKLTAAHFQMLGHIARARAYAIEGRRSLVMADELRQNGLVTMFGYAARITEAGQNELAEYELRHRPALAAARGGGEVTISSRCRRCNGSGTAEATKGCTSCPEYMERDAEIAALRKQLDENAPLVRALEVNRVVTQERDTLRTLLGDLVDAVGNVVLGSGAAAELAQDAWEAAHAYLHPEG